MATTLGLVSLVVSDYDEAIDWYTKTLEFNLLEDSPQGDGKRWVVIGPSSGSGAKLLLAKAANAQQINEIGKAASGRVAFFLHTDAFDLQYQNMLTLGVHFRETPRNEPYGKVAVFDDLYGNGWDLIGPA